MGTWVLALVLCLGPTDRACQVVYRYGLADRPACAALGQDLAAQHWALLAPSLPRGAEPYTLIDCRSAS